MAILNYTTKISADKTASEIAKMLSMAGARSILTEYDEECSFVESITFRMEINGAFVAFKLPTDWRPVLEVLENDRKVPRSFETKEQAIRVAWRIVRSWIEAQLAILETRMVKPEQVFLPYVIMNNGKTISENIEETSLLSNILEDKLLLE